MQPESEPASTPMWMVVVGWFFSLLIGAAFIGSAVVKFMEIKPDDAPDLGWFDSAMLGLGIVELSCAILYLFPRTAVLGAILLTGYLGGAVATHLRMGDFFGAPILVGVLLWFGLLLRDARVRSCLPWRTDPSETPYGGFLAGAAKTFLTLLVLIGVIAALVVAMPPTSKVSRSITVDAPAAKVFAQVNDFHKWTAWSPFEKMDTNLKKTYEGPDSGVGAIYKWSGAETGEGMMTILESRPNEKIRIKLDFIKPFEASGIAEFTFKEGGNKTVVTWTFIGGNDDFLTKAFSAFMSTPPWGLGGTFDDGLKSLKAVAESPNAK